MSLQDAIDQIKTQFSSVESALFDAKNELAKTIEENKKWDAALEQKKMDHATLIAQLDAKRVQAETAARENAKRIEVNNSQMLELLKVQTELDRREKAVSQRENVVEIALKKIADQDKALDARLIVVARKEEEINRRYAKMKEAVS